MDKNIFDEFIRANTQKNLDPPEELNWEHMDIPLPDAGSTSFNPFSANGFGILFLVLAGVTLAYFSFTNSNTGQTSNNISTNFSTPLNEENLSTNQQQKTKANQVKDVVKNNLVAPAVEPLTSSQEKLVSKNRKQDSSISDKNISENKLPVERNSIKKGSSADNKPNKHTKVTATKNTVLQKVQKSAGLKETAIQPIQNNNVTHSIDKNTDTQKTTALEETAIQPIENNVSHSIDKNKVAQETTSIIAQKNNVDQQIHKNTIKGETTKRSLQTADEPVIKNSQPIIEKTNTPVNVVVESIEKSKFTQPLETIVASSITNLTLLPNGISAPLQTTKLPVKKHSKYGLTLSAGYNRMIGNLIDDIQMDSLSTNESSEWGNSYNLSFEHLLKKNYFVSLGISYNSLHTSFTYRKNLGVYNDFTTQNKVRKTRYVYHNNYFKFIQFRAGAGKQFEFNKHWSSQVLAHISPTLKTCHSGRALDENQTIVSIEDMGTEKDWFLSASIDWRLSYQINKLNIFAGTGFNQNLSKGKFLEENIHSSLYKQSVSLYLGLKRDF